MGLLKGERFLVVFSFVPPAAAGGSKFEAAVQHQGCPVIRAAMELFGAVIRGRISPDQGQGEMVGGHPVEDQIPFVGIVVGDHAIGLRLMEGIVEIEQADRKRFERLSLQPDHVRVQIVAAQVVLADDLPLEPGPPIGGTVKQGVVAFVEAGVAVG